VIWDEQGQVLGVAISTYDEKHYIVQQDEMGRELISHLRKCVRANGSFVEEKGEIFIAVDRYSLVEMNQTSERIPRSLLRE